MSRWDDFVKNERNKPEQNINIDQIEKEILKSMENDIKFSFMDGYQSWINTIGTYSTYIQNSHNSDILTPERIIYNDRATICYWKDGTKTVVNATGDDHMTHEHGVAMCIIRKLFPNRQEFLRVVNSGYDVIEEARKREIAEKERKEKAHLEELRIKTRKEELSQLRRIDEKLPNGD